MNNLKSAVAFFFLFFLHGTSFGNGQQGISYNVPQLGEVRDFQHKCQLELLNLKYSTKCQ